MLIFRLPDILEQIHISLFKYKLFFLKKKKKKNIYFLSFSGGFVNFILNNQYFSFLFFPQIFFFPKWKKVKYGDEKEQGRKIKGKEESPLIKDALSFFFLNKFLSPPWNI